MADNVKKSIIDAFGRIVPLQVTDDLTHELLRNALNFNDVGPVKPIAGKTLEDKNPPLEEITKLLKEILGKKWDEELENLKKSVDLAIDAYKQYTLKEKASRSPIAERKEGLDVSAKLAEALTAMPKFVQAKAVAANTIMPSMPKIEGVEPFVAVFSGLKESIDAMAGVLNTKSATFNITADITGYLDKKKDISLIKRQINSLVPSGTDKAEKTLTFKIDSSITDPKVILDSISQIKNLKLPEIVISASNVQFDPNIFTLSAATIKIDELNATATKFVLPEATQTVNRILGENNIPNVTTKTQKINRVLGLDIPNIAPEATQTVNRVLGLDIPNIAEATQTVNRVLGQEIPVIISAQSVQFDPAVAAQISRYLQAAHTTNIPDGLIAAINSGNEFNRVSSEKLTSLERHGTTVGSIQVSDNITHQKLDILTGALVAANNAPLNTSVKVTGLDATVKELVKLTPELSKTSALLTMATTNLDRSAVALEGLLAAPTKKKPEDCCEKLVKGLASVIRAIRKIPAGPPIPRPTPPTTPTTPATPTKKKVKLTDGLTVDVDKPDKPDFKAETFSNYGVKDFLHDVQWMMKSLENALIGYDPLHRVMAGSVRNQMEFRKELDQTLFVQRGITLEQRGMQRAVEETLMNQEDLALTGQQVIGMYTAQGRAMTRGIRDARVLNRTMMAAGTTASMIGANVEGVAETFATWNLQLGLNNMQMSQMGRSVVEVGRNTGLTGENLMRAVKSTEQFLTGMRNAGTLSAETARNFMIIRANAERSGVADQADRMLKGLQSGVDFMFTMDDQMRSFMLMAANAGGGQGLMNDLIYGRAGGSRASLRGLATGIETLIRRVAGVGIDQLESLSEGERFRVDAVLFNAFNIRIGQVERMAGALQEAGRGFGGNLALITAAENEALNMQDATQRAEQERFLASQRQQLILQENLRIQTQIGEAITKARPGQTMDEIIGSTMDKLRAESTRAGEDFGTTLRSMNITATTNTGIVRQSLMNTYDEVRRQLVAAGKPEALGIEPQNIAGEIDRAMADRSGVAYRELMARINQAQQAAGVLGGSSQTSPMAQLDLTINRLNATLMRFTNNALTQFIDGTGYAGLAAITFGAAALAGVAALIRLTMTFSRGINSMRTWLGIIPTTTTTVAGAATTTTTAATTPIRASSLITKLARVLGPIAAIADLGLGAWTGISQAETTGRGGLSAGILGALTGDATIGGGMLSSLFGTQRGTETDEMVGVAGAAGRGALIGTGIGAAFGPVGAAIGLATGAITGAIAELVKIATDAGSVLGQSLRNMSGKFMEGIQFIIDGFISAWTEISQALEEPFAELKTMVVDFLKEIGGVTGEIDWGKTFESIGSGLRATGEFLGLATKAVGKFITGAIKPLWEWAKLVVEGIITILKGNMKILSGIWDVIAGLFTLDFDRVWKGVKGIFSGIGKVVIGALEVMVAFVAGVPAMLMSAGAAGWSRLFAWYSNEIGGTFGNVLRETSQALSGLSQMAKGFITILRGLFSWDASKVREGFGQIKDGFVQLMSNLKNIGILIWNALKEVNWRGVFVTILENIGVALKAIFVDLPVWIWNSLLSVDWIDLFTTTFENIGVALRTIFVDFIGEGILALGEIDWMGILANAGDAIVNIFGALGNINIDWNDLLKDVGKGIGLAIKLILWDIPGLLGEAFMAIDWMNLLKNAGKGIGLAIKLVLWDIPLLLAKAFLAIDWFEVVKATLIGVGLAIKLVLWDIPLLLVKAIMSIDWIDLGKFILDSIVFVLLGIPRIIGNILTNIGAGVLEAMPGLDNILKPLTMAADFILNICERIWVGIRNTWNAILDFLFGHSIIPDIYDGFVKWFGKLLAFFTELPGKLLAAISQLPVMLGNFIMGAIPAIGATIPGFDTLLRSINDFNGWLVTAPARMFGFVRGAVADLVAILRDGFENMIWNLTRLLDVGSMMRAVMPRSAVEAIEVTDPNFFDRLNIGNAIRGSAAASGFAPGARGAQSHLQQRATERGLEEAKTGLVNEAGNVLNATNLTQSMNREITPEQIQASLANIGGVTLVERQRNAEQQITNLETDVQQAGSLARRTNLVADWDKLRSLARELSATVQASQALARSPNTADAQMRREEEARNAINDRNFEGTNPLALERFSAAMSGQFTANLQAAQRMFGVPQQADYERLIQPVLRLQEEGAFTTDAIDIIRDSLRGATERGSPAERMRAWQDLSQFERMTPNNEIIPFNDLLRSSNQSSSLLEDIRNAGLRQGSLYTHDEGMHARLDKIIGYIIPSGDFLEKLGIEPIINQIAQPILPGESPMAIEEKVRTQQINNKPQLVEVVVTNDNEETDKKSRELLETISEYLAEIKELLTPSRRSGGGKGVAASGDDIVFADPALDPTYLTGKYTQSSTFDGNDLF